MLRNATQALAIGAVLLFLISGGSSIVGVHPLAQSSGTGASSPAGVPVQELAGTSLPALSELEHASLSPVPDASSDGVLPGSVPVPGTSAATLSIDVTLSLANASRLSGFLAALSDPSSPQYHRYLTASQFDALYSPSAAVYSVAVAYFEAGGAVDLTTHPDRTSFSFEASVPVAGALFHTLIASYTLDGRAYLAPSAPPELPGPLASVIAGVSGLGTSSQLSVGPASGGLAVHASVPSSLLAPAESVDGGYQAPPTVNGTQFEYVADFQVAYDETPLFAEYGYPTDVDVATILTAGEYTGPTGPTPCGELTQGQNVGPFVPADIYDYYNETLPAGEPHSKVVAVPLDGAALPGPAASCDGTWAGGENTIDLESIGSMAPGATIYNVYVPFSEFSDAGEDEALQQILSPSLSLPASVRSGLLNVSVISNSWGSTEVNDTGWYEGLEEAQARGITVVACSGDSDDNVLSAKYFGSTLWFPASMAYDDFGDVAVGGTTVTLDPSTLGLESQVVWNISAQDAKDGGPAGSTGGISSSFAEPTWQARTEANTVIRGAGRGDPDLAGLANNTLFTYTANNTQYLATNASVNGRFAWAWGTSVSAPLTAGMLAEIDHALESTGRPSLGFPDPEAYALGNSSYYGALGRLPFEDVTSGSNYLYAALPGYDLVTGWGSLNAANFTEEVIPSSNVTFTETGIPAKTLAKDGWTVVLNGLRQWSTARSITFTGVPNGTYPLLLTGPRGYQTTSAYALGTQAVAGATTVSIGFFKGKTYTLKFTEKGLPKGQTWCVGLDGSSSCTTRSSEKFVNLSSSATYGAYSYLVSSPRSGQNITEKVGSTTTYGPRGTIEMSKSATVGLTFAYRYAVTFTESGLTSGTWSVTVKGHTETAAWNVAIEFDLTNGTYAYKLGAEPGYKAKGSPTKVVVPTAVSVSVAFSKRS